LIALFWICGVILVASALWVISSRQPVHSVIGLIINFAALAVLFLTLSAEFLAMMQIIIYAGAILVLFLFVIALLTAGDQPVEQGRGRLQFQAAPSIVAGLAALLAMGVGVRVAWSASAAGSTQGLGTVATFGTQLLTTHVFAFEVTALILLIAIVGVIMMAGRKEVRF
jgi:NADH-quinone oxidoreductase subunit J